MEGIKHSVSSAGDRHCPGHDMKGPISFGTLLSFVSNMLGHFPSYSDYFFIANFVPAGENFPKTLQYYEKELFFLCLPISPIAVRLKWVGLD